MAVLASDVKQFRGDKILAHLDRVAEWLRSGCSRPIVYELDMTNRCNSACPYCFGYFPRRDGARLEGDEACSFLAQIASFGGRAVTFTGGGEPLLHPQTPAVMQHARDLGLDVALITNGLALTPTLSARLVDVCQWIRVSVDAADEETYSLTHGVDGDHFRALLGNISGLAQAARDGSGPCTVGYAYLTSPETIPGMVAATRLAKELRVHYIQFRPLLYRKENGNRAAEMRAFAHELLRCVNYADDSFDVLFSRAKYRDMARSRPRPYRACYGQNFAAVIAADARMYLCCHSRGVQKYCLGDLRRERLSDIWQRPRRGQVVQSSDFADCTPWCRCHAMNCVLQGILGKREHANFL
jgi:MoaA/NifB/PqqE/SkfB family radical SAM enzyme